MEWGKVLSAMFVSGSRGCDGSVSGLLTDWFLKRLIF